MLKMVWSGKNLIGQANSQTLSDRMSCKVSATFVNTAICDLVHDVEAIHCLC